MDKKSMVLSASCLELINNTDNIIYKLLYDENNGYTKLKSKEAVTGASKVIEKFNYEVQKLTKNGEFQSIRNIIEEKRKGLISFIDGYYNQQLRIWCEEVFKEFLENILFSVMLNKNNGQKLKELSYQAYRAIEWLSLVKEFSNKTKEKYIEDFNSRLQQVYLSKDEDYLPKGNPEISDYSLFLKYRNDLIKKEPEKIELDSTKLNKEDIAYFTRLINDFKNHKQTRGTDEIMLVNSAISLMNLKSDKEKYEFIKEVDGDISDFLIKNKKMDENEKIELIKRRMKLFEDSSKMKETSSYFKKLLISY